MTIQVDNALPPNVVEIGNEITQGVVDGLMSATPAPTSANPYATKTQLDGKLSLTGGTMTANASVNFSSNVYPETPFLNFIVNNGDAADFGGSVSGDGFNFYDNNSEYIIDGGYYNGFTHTNGDTNLSTILNFNGITFPDSTVQTTAAVAPTFATTAQAQAGTSTTTVINPATLREMLVTSNYTRITSSGMVTATTGTGGTNDSNGTDFNRVACPTSAANVVTARYRALNMQKTGSLSSNISWANGVALYFRLNLNSTTGTDPNSTGVITIGEGTVQTAVFPTARSIGIQLNFGSNIKILAHDGTTLTTFTTSTSVASLYLNASDFLLTNDYATGTVTLYLNGTSIGSTTGGVTSHASGFNARNQFNMRAFNQSVPSGTQLGFTIFGATAIVL